MAGKSFFNKWFYDPSGDTGEVPEEESKSLTIPRLNLTGQGVADLSAVAASRTPIGEVDDDFFQKLRVEIGRVPVPEGFRQFVTIFTAMKDSIADPEERFKIAFKTCKSTHGLSVEQIRTALRDQTSALAQELKEFTAGIAHEATEIKKQNTGKVQAASQEILQTEQRIEELKKAFEEQLQSLQAQKTRLESEKRTSEEELNKIDGDLEVTRKSFESSHQAVLDGYAKTGWIGIATLNRLLVKLETNLT